jgi:polyisoprenoid-binding protein YceI
VVGTAQLEKDEKQMKVIASFTIKTSDFGISTPTFSGITVAEDIDVKVLLEAPFSSL